MKIYFVATDSSSVEAEVIREIQPKRLLMSYYYFRNKGIESFIEKVGYRPEILLDSGAFTAWGKGRNISPVDYMKFIEQNRQCIDKYIALDVIEDGQSGEISKRYYDIMRVSGFSPIPVYHEGDDEKYLDYYAEKSEIIALGGTAKNRSKPQVREWVSGVISKYPSHKFHLLGSSSKQITDYCDLHSFDSSTWVMMAFNGYPKHIKGRDREAKIERAVYNMQDLTTQYKGA